MYVDRKDKILWECSNGGQLWTEDAAANTAAAGKTVTAMPGGFCALGYGSLNTAFIVSLLVDIVCQVSSLKISQASKANTVSDIYVLPGMAILQAAGALQPYERAFPRR